MRRLVIFQVSLTAFVTEFTTKTEDKFYLMETYLAASDGFPAGITAT